MPKRSTRFYRVKAHTALGKIFGCVAILMLLYTGEEYKDYLRQVLLKAQYAHYLIATSTAMDDFLTGAGFASSCSESCSESNDYTQSDIISFDTFVPKKLAIK